MDSKPNSCGLQAAIGIGSGMTMYSFATESFADADLEMLRDELLRSGLDSWQAAELLSAFLVERGYGVSNHDARSAATRIESVGCKIECMRQELQKLALVM